MFTNNKTATAVRLALIATIATTGANAFAASETDTVERISVTGSKISRADMETSSPVTVIGAADIAASGAISIDDILQDMTAAGGAMTHPGINNGSGGNARINLRGLGSNRTLVLVNGRRMIASGTGAASTVDLNSIPVSMIQRVEILKDRATALYATDAVAGLVNIILKRDYEGFEINVQGGATGHNDAEKTSIDFTLGTSFDKGNLVIGVQYTDRGDASQADRGYSNCPISETTDDDGVISLYCGGSSYTPFGHVWGPD
ncbi:MAG: TonB-dependent receptor plug domain-containing protein, partial [Gammaproteobacteria bacterium]|nr:TonB-dependent receptor plug domain-containing protein [Gammaproteobacteria bacterium]